MLQAYYTHNQDIRQEILVIVYILLIIILRFYNIPAIGMKTGISPAPAAYKPHNYCNQSQYRQHGNHQA